jgi:hypothetical protein
MRYYYILKTCRSFNYLVLRGELSAILYYNSVPFIKNKALYLNKPLSYKKRYY